MISPIPERRSAIAVWFARLLILVLFVGAALVKAPDATASFTSSVRVVTHELHNGECLDGWLFCNRPELRVDVVLDTNDGRQVRGCTGPTNPSFDNIVEDQTVCAGVEVSGDFTVRVTLVDVDACAPGDTGCTPSVTAADLKDGPDQSWEAGPFVGGRASTTRVATSGGPSSMVFSVINDPVAAGITINEPPGQQGGNPVATFDPTVGERVRFRAVLSEPTRIGYSVIRRASPGAPSQTFVLHEAPAWNPNLNLDWDGRVPGSATPLADGVYDLTLRDLSHYGPGAPAVSSRPVLLQRAHGNVVQVRLTDLSPDNSWDFRNGPVTLTGNISAGGKVQREAAPMNGSSCSTAWSGAIWRGPEVQRGAGQIELAWDGRNDARTLVPAGLYCARVKLTSAGVSVYSNDLELRALPRSTGLEAWAFPNPIIPVDRTQGRRASSIRALVVDAAHRDRYVARVSIEVSPAGPPGAPVAFAPRIVATCERASSCTAALPSDLAAARAIAYRATATEDADAPGGPVMWTGPWRLTDLNPLPLRIWRAFTPAMVSSAGMVTAPPVTSTLDIIYYPGSGNDLTIPSQASRFAVQVSGNVVHLFGLGSERGPTSFATTSTAVSFIVSPQHVVSVTGTGLQICGWSGLVPVSYADAHGVLHHAGCRDAAYQHSREYSSDNATTDWHELHHALYAEADEYCCDGGYRDGINVYGSFGSCLSSSSPGATCARLIDSNGASASAAKTGWFRGDPLPDVMVGNELVENADDRRAAARTFARCASGGC